VIGISLVVIDPLATEQGLDHRLLALLGVEPFRKELDLLLQPLLPAFHDGEVDPLAVVEEDVVLELIDEPGVLFLFFQLALELDPVPLTDKVASVTPFFMFHLWVGLISVMELAWLGEHSFIEPDYLPRLKLDRVPKLLLGSNTVLDRLDEVGHNVQFDIFELWLIFFEGDFYVLRSQFKNEFLVVVPHKEVAVHHEVDLVQRYIVLALSLENLPIGNLDRFEEPEQVDNEFIVEAL